MISKNVLWRVPASLAALALAVALSGCPVSAEYRNTDPGRGPGDLLGPRPTAPVVVTISGFDAAYTGTATVTLHDRGSLALPGGSLVGSSQTADVRHGTITVVFPAVPFPPRGDFVLQLGEDIDEDDEDGTPPTFTAGLPLTVGANPTIALSQFDQGGVAPPAP